VFEEIYAKGGWHGVGSGRGSTPEYTAPFRHWLAQFMRDNAVRSVIDFGCGDWQWAVKMDWTDIDYLGLDVVPQVVRDNIALHERSGVHFERVAPDFSDVPQWEADLLLVKDVMQHWPLLKCQQFLALPWRCRLALFVNDGPISDNVDVEEGGYAMRDLQFAPFWMKVEDVYRWNHKVVQLWRRRWPSESPASS